MLQAAPTDSSELPGPPFPPPPPPPTWTGKASFKQKHILPAWCTRHPKMNHPGWLCSMGPTSQIAARAMHSCCLLHGTRNPPKAFRSCPSMFSPHLASPGTPTWWAALLLMELPALEM